MAGVETATRKERAPGELICPTRLRDTERMRSPALVRAAACLLPRRKGDLSRRWAWPRGVDGEIPGLNANVALVCLALCKRCSCHCETLRTDQFVHVTQGFPSEKTKCWASSRMSAAHFGAGHPLQSGPTCMPGRSLQAGWRQICPL